MRKELLLPITALAGGAIGFFLRRWELFSAFEADSGLPVAGAPATIALIALSCVIAAILALGCRGLHRIFVGGYDHAFAAYQNTPYMMGVTAAAFLFLISGALMLLDLPVQYQQAADEAALYGHRVSYFSLLPQTLLAAFAILSGVSVFLLGKNNFKNEGKGKFSACLLLPAYGACIWLIAAYQQRSGDPIVLDYVYQLFAIIASVLGAYFIAGFAFERPKTYHALLFSLLAVYFSLVTLADSHTPASLLLCGAFLLYFLASDIVLLHNLSTLFPASRGKRVLKYDKSDREGTPDEG